MLCRPLVRCAEEDDFDEELHKHLKRFKLSPDFQKSYKGMLSGETLSSLELSLFEYLFLSLLLFLKQV